MLDHFLFRAVLAGVAVALAAAPLGCFVVWRRMAYFGDATSHAALLGVALSLAFSLSIFFGTLLVALAMALTVAALGERRQSMDTLLGVLAHAALAFGLVIVSFVPSARIEITAWLFGDLLSVSRLDVAIIWTGAALTTALVAWRWSRLLTATLNADLAVASGIDPRHERLLLSVALALVVTVAIKVVGALLITALLIVPAATARLVARTPERMALVAALLGTLAVTLGLAAAWQLDSPAGPTIVSVAALLFFAANALALLCRARGA